MGSNPNPNPWLADCLSKHDALDGADVPVVAPDALNKTKPGDFLQGIVPLSEYGIDTYKEDSAQDRYAGLAATIKQGAMVFYDGQKDSEGDDQKDSEGDEQKDSNKNILAIDGLDQDEDTAGKLREMHNIMIRPPSERRMRSLHELAIEIMQIGKTTYSKKKGGAPDVLYAWAPAKKNVPVASLAPLGAPTPQQSQEATTSAETDVTPAAGTGSRAVRTLRKIAPGQTSSAEPVQPVSSAEPVQPVSSAEPAPAEASTAPAANPQYRVFIKKKNDSFVHTDFQNGADWNMVQSGGQAGGGAPKKTFDRKYRYRPFVSDAEKDHVMKRLFSEKKFTKTGNGVPLYLNMLNAMYAMVFRKPSILQELKKQESDVPGYYLFDVKDDNNKKQIFAEYQYLRRWLNEAAYTRVLFMVDGALQKHKYNGQLYVLCVNSYNLQAAVKMLNEMPVLSKFGGANNRDHPVNVALGNLWTLYGKKEPGHIRSYPSELVHVTHLYPRREVSQDGLLMRRLMRRSYDDTGTPVSTAIAISGMTFEDVYGSGGQRRDFLSSVFEQHWKYKDTDCAPRLDVLPIEADESKFKFKYTCDDGTKTNFDIVGIDKLVETLQQKQNKYAKHVLETLNGLYTPEKMAYLQDEETRSLLVEALCPAPAPVPPPPPSPVPEVSFKCERDPAVEINKDGILERLQEWNEKQKYPEKNANSRQTTQEKVELLIGIFETYKDSKTALLARIVKIHRRFLEDVLCIPACLEGLYQCVTGKKNDGTTYSEKLGAVLEALGAHIRKVGGADLAEAKSNIEAGIFYREDAELLASIFCPPATPPALPDPVSLPPGTVQDRSKLWVLPSLPVVSVDGINTDKLDALRCYDAMAFMLDDNNHWCLCKTVRIKAKDFENVGAFVNSCLSGTPAASATEKADGETQTNKSTTDSGTQSQGQPATKDTAVGDDDVRGKSTVDSGTQSEPRSQITAETQTPNPDCKDMLTAYMEKCGTGTITCDAQLFSTCVMYVKNCLAIEPNVTGGKCEEVFSLADAALGFLNEKCNCLETNNYAFKAVSAAKQLVIKCDALTCADVVEFLTKHPGCLADPAVLNINIDFWRAVFELNINWADIFSNINIDFWRAVFELNINWADIFSNIDINIDFWNAVFLKTTNEWTEINIQNFWQAVPPPIKFQINVIESKTKKDATDASTQMVAEERKEGVDASVGPDSNGKGEGVDTSVGTVSVASKDVSVGADDVLFPKNEVETQTDPGPVPDCMELLSAMFDLVEVSKQMSDAADDVKKGMETGVMKLPSGKSYLGFSVPTHAVIRAWTAAAEMKAGTMNVKIKDGEHGTVTVAHRHLYHRFIQAYENLTAPQSQQTHGGSPGGSPMQNIFGVEYIGDGVIVNYVLGNDRNTRFVPQSISQYLQYKTGHSWKKANIAEIYKIVLGQVGEGVYLHEDLNTKQFIRGKHYFESKDALVVTFVKNRMTGRLICNENCFYVVIPQVRLLGYEVDMIEAKVHGTARIWKKETPRSVAPPPPAPVAPPPPRPVASPSPLPVAERPPASAATQKLASEETKQPPKPTPTPDCPDTRCPVDWWFVVKEDSEPSFEIIHKYASDHFKSIQLYDKYRLSKGDYTFPPALDVDCGRLLQQASSITCMNDVFDVQELEGAIKELKESADEASAEVDELVEKATAAQAEAAEAQAEVAKARAEAAAAQAEAAEAQAEAAEARAEAAEARAEVADAADAAKYAANAANQAKVQAVEGKAAEEVAKATAAQAVAEAKAKAAEAAQAAAEAKAEAAQAAAEKAATSQAEAEPAMEKYDVVNSDIQELKDLKDQHPDAAANKEPVFQDEGKKIFKVKLKISGQDKDVKISKAALKYLVEKGALNVRLTPDNEAIARRLGYLPRFVVTRDFTALVNKIAGLNPDPLPQEDGSKSGPIRIGTEQKGSLKEQIKLRRSGENENALDFYITPQLNNALFNALGQFAIATNGIYIYTYKSKYNTETWEKLLTTEEHEFVENKLSNSGGGETSGNGVMAVAGAALTLLAALAPR